MRSLITLILLLVCVFPQPSSSAEEDNQKLCIVLLHGLRRTSSSMLPMSRALTLAGYTTINMDYDSNKYPVEKLASFVIPDAINNSRAKNCTCIHFVTHSMGGIILRYYLSKHRLPQLGRIVMLSPPNQGSEVVDALKHMAIFKWFNGPAGQQLGTDSNSIATRLGPITYPLGIITGNKSGFFDVWISKYIPGENDGKVSVQRAKVEGMTDFLVLPYSHTFIMRKKQVIFQTRHFLEHGSFYRKNGIKDN